MGSRARTSPGLVTLHVRDAQSGDLKAILEIERLSFSDPWSARMFRPHLYNRAYPFLVAEEQRTVVGFAVAQTVVSEAELLDIAVHPGARGRGVGATLLEALMAQCAVQGAVTMTLEVRESNGAARALYNRYGFDQVGRRRRYYHDPTEDALILQATLPAEK